MKAKIKNGLIKAISKSTDLQYDLPKEITFSNYKEYACINIKNTKDINSWVKISEKEYKEDIVIPKKSLINKIKSFFKTFFNKIKSWILTKIA
jgi:hypothetical protein